MKRLAVTGSPGFISIAVSDVNRSAAFYTEHLGATRDTFDWGPESAGVGGVPAGAGGRAHGPPACPTRTATGSPSTSGTNHSSGHRPDSAGYGRRRAAPVRV